MRKIDTNPVKVGEVLVRGVAEAIDAKNLRQRLLSGKRLRIKLGIDPTSPHIHLGRSIPLMKLRDFQELGHQVVLIIGDFTGLVGDTSDKMSERPMLEQKTVKENMATYLEQAQKILDTKHFELHHNSEWLATLRYQEICAQADLFSIAEFINRENIKKRLDAQKRVSLREILYPLMQGYDSVAIKADVELGGTDQRFNLLAGRRLQDHFGQKPQDVLMTHLIAGLDGRKMSSSWGNTINLTDAPNEMYGKVMSMADELMMDYFVHCTRVPLIEIDNLHKGLKDGENPKFAKEKLALTITQQYWGESRAKEAQEHFRAVFREGKLPTQMPEIKLAEKEMNILDLLVRCGLCPTKSEARHMVEQGAVRVNQQVVSDWRDVVSDLNNKVVQVGKRKYCRLKR